MAVRKREITPLDMALRRYCDAHGTSFIGISKALGIDSRALGNAFSVRQHKGWRGMNVIRMAVLFCIRHAATPEEQRTLVREYLIEMRDFEIVRHIAPASVRTCVDEIMSVLIVTGALDQVGQGLPEEARQSERFHRKLSNIGGKDAA